MESPNTRFQNERTKVRTREETRNPRKSVLTSKVVSPFTRALYIPRLPSNLKKYS
jgi:hypothetical protein